METRISGARPASQANATLQTTVVAAAGVVEVRSVGPMGKGLIAMRDITRGTRITEEEALFVIYDQPPHEERTQEAFAQAVAAFCGVAQNLPPDKLRKLDQLCYDASYDNASDKNRIREWYRAEGILDEHGRTLGGWKLSQAVVEMARRYTIFRDNRIRTGVDDTGQDNAIFPLYSRINHSCSPNAHPHYNGTTGRLTVHATRHIEAGEQVLVQYVNTACLPRDQRQERTRRFGFACECSMCTAPDLAAEPLRQRMHQLKQGITQYVNRGPVRPPGTPGSPRQALQDVEELIQLLQHPSIDLQNTSLSHAYRAGFKINLEILDIRKATEYAQKDLDLMLSMVGTDDTIYMPTEGYHGRLGHWFRHLQDMHDMDLGDEALDFDDDSDADDSEDDG